MELRYSELGNHIRLIKLIGRLDAAGFNDIDLKFTGYCSGEKPRVLVDLSEVSFLASIGIRLFTLNAKSLAQRGGKLVLLNPDSNVKNVLELTGILDIIPIHDSLESAQAVLL
jgi:anti-anti-sigma factor